MDDVAIAGAGPAGALAATILARADDATAVSWNPAGLSYLGRPEFSIVGTRNSFERGPCYQQCTRAANGSPTQPPFNFCVRI